MLWEPFSEERSFVTSLNTVLQDQGVQLTLADMAIGVETSRLAWMLAAYEMDQGRRGTFYSSIAKAMASDVANKCAADAVQVTHQHILDCFFCYMHDPPLTRCLA